MQGPQEGRCYCERRYLPNVLQVRTVCKYYCAPSLPSYLPCLGYFVRLGACGSQGNPTQSIHTATQQPTPAALADWYGLWPLRSIGAGKQLKNGARAAHNLEAPLWVYGYHVLRSTTAGSITPICPTKHMSYQLHFFYFGGLSAC